MMPSLSRQTFEVHYWRLLFVSWGTPTRRSNWQQAFGFDNCLFFHIADRGHPGKQGLQSGLAGLTDKLSVKVCLGGDPSRDLERLAQLTACSPLFLFFQ